MNKTNQKVTDYDAVAAQVKQQHIRSEAQQHQIENGSLHTVATMHDLAPTMQWSGAISAGGHAALSDNQTTTYHSLIKQSLVFSGKGGQVGCMDGRVLSEAMQLGPKMASGTHGNALRLMLASIADPSSDALDYESAFTTMAAIDSTFGYRSGTHALDQCGAQKFAAYAVQTIATQSVAVASAAQTFLTAVGYTYNDEIQSKITEAAHQLKGLPENEHATQVLQTENVAACPSLPGDHKEKSIVVFLDHNMTLDNNKLVELTVRELGVEAQAFGYSWGYHVQIAQELSSSLGDYYLHSVASQDVPVLTQLTDGSLDILAFKKG